MSEDPRERHLVCKLDRYQLEDKYLRLLDEASSLKKLSNCQEDKIKRLGTKLIRLASNPRSCGLALDIVEDRNRTAALELENTKVDRLRIMIHSSSYHDMITSSFSRKSDIYIPSYFPHNINIQLRHILIKLTRNIMCRILCHRKFNFKIDIPRCC